MAGKKKKDTNFNPLSLSFLDIMSCGLGAVILIFLILKHGEAKSPEEVVRINKDISANETKIEQLEEEIVTKQTKINNSLSSLKNIQNQIKAIEKVIVDENKRKNLSEGENKAIESLILTLNNEKQDVVQVEGEGERKYLTGLKVEGNRIAFILDSSASMLDESIVDIVKGSLMGDQIKQNYEKWLRAKKSLKWLVARLPASSEFTIITFNEKVVSHSNKRWMSGSDVSAIQATLGSALNEVPKGGTNLEVALEEVQQMNPMPDSVYLITDGLPTKGMPPKGVTLDRVKKCFRVGSKNNPITTISSECRVELFEKAKNNYLATNKIKTSTILFPLEGDPHAAVQYWSLAVLSGGMLISPSKDWP